MCFLPENALTLQGLTNFVKYFLIFEEHNALHFSPIMKYQVLFSFLKLGKNLKKSSAANFCRHFRG